MIKCRHCEEIKTLENVLEFCMIDMKNKTYIIANAKKSVGFTIIEETHCISDSGSSRRSDIIASKDEQGYISLTQR